MIDQLRAELHKLATSTSPDADRCADALAALVEPLTPTSGQLVAWLEGRGWTVEIGGPTTWGQMRRGEALLSIPMLEGARDRERCVRRLFDDVAHVEGIRRSRVVVDLWAATLASPAPT